MRGVRHAGIVRLVGFSARAQGGACALVLERYGGELGHGSLITVDPTRVRVRPPD